MNPYMGPRAKPPEAPTELAPPPSAVLSQREAGPVPTGLHAGTTENARGRGPGGASPGRPP